MVALAIVVGLGGGLGAVAFRYLVYGATWIITGNEQYGLLAGQPSSHVPWMGRWFLLAAPIVGGLVFGPLIQRFAREARGHGVPEVMLAVAENGGRIRPQVTVVKALASAICIGTGGSVGREGPIVQIGSALASSLGQVVRVNEDRLRLLVACGAAAGISATFNAPLTGVFFGLELVLGSVSAEAIAVLLVASVTADALSRAVFGSAPFFGGLTTTSGHSLLDYILFAALGLLAGLVGVLFKTVLYGIEDVCDRVWRGRPEWLRPAVGGIVLGLILFAIPELYGVGYPVMGAALSGTYLFGFLVLLTAGKMVASSLTIGIGGSGGVFAPSLFIGATFGAAYAVLVHHMFGASASSETAYGLVAMGAVFAGGTRAPLTASASVLEMSGDFGMVLPVMLGAALASAVSTRLTQGTIYTTKLIRRGIDIERPKTGAMLRLLTVADAMVPLSGPAAAPDSFARRAAAVAMRGGEDGGQGELQGRPPGTLDSEETIEDALTDLIRFGRDGLPVLGDDGHSVIGWVTDRDVLRTLLRRLGHPVAQGEKEVATLPGAGECLARDFVRAGYRLVEFTVPMRWERGRRIRDIAFPPSTLVVVLRRGSDVFPPAGGTELEAGDRLTVITTPSQMDRVQRAILADHRGGRSGGRRDGSNG
jgi:chloride channel protein, CIC family